MLQYFVVVQNSLLELYLLGSTGVHDVLLVAVSCSANKFFPFLYKTPHWTTTFAEALWTTQLGVAKLRTSHGIAGQKMAYLHHISHYSTRHNTRQAITWNQMTWPPQYVTPPTDTKTSKHLTSKQKISPPWNSTIAKKWRGVPDLHRDPVSSVLCAGPPGVAPASFVLSCSSCHSCSSFCLSWLFFSFWDSSSFGQSSGKKRDLNAWASSGVMFLVNSWHWWRAQLSCVIPSLWSSHSLLALLLSPPNMVFVWVFSAWGAKKAAVRTQVRAFLSRGESTELTFFGNNTRRANTRVTTLRLHGY